MEKAFNNWKPGALKMNFSNGNGLSTIWGDGSYTENNMSTTLMDYLLGDDKQIPAIKSDDVEIMFDCGAKLNDKILKKYNDGDAQPIGHLSQEKWLEIVILLAKEKKD